MFRIEVTERPWLGDNEDGSGPRYGPPVTRLVQEMDSLDLPALIAHLNRLAPEPCCAKCGKVERDHPWGRTTGTYTGSSLYMAERELDGCKRFVTQQEARADRLEAELEKAFDTFRQLVEDTREELNREPTGTTPQEEGS